MLRFPRRTTLPAALWAASLVLLLGACAPSPEPAPAPATSQPAPPASASPADAAIDAVDAASRTCDTGPVQGLVGQQATEAVIAKATADSGSSSVRVLKPGDPATMDFRPERLNIITTDAGVIETLRCG